MQVLSIYLSNIHTQSYSNGGIGEQRGVRILRKDIWHANCRDGTPNLQISR